MPTREEMMDTATGHLVRLVRDEIRRFDMAETAFTNLPDEKREEIMDDIAGRCDEVLADLVALIEEHGFCAVNAKLVSVEFKDGVKAVLKVGMLDEHRHAIADAAGGNVKLLIPLDHMSLGIGDIGRQEKIEFGGNGESEAATEGDD